MIKNLIQRTISGAVFISVMIAVIWFGDTMPYVFGAVFLLLTALGLREFYALSDNIEEVKTSKTVSIIGGIFLFGVLYSLSFPFQCKDTFFLIFISLYFLSTTTIFLLELFRNQKNPIQNIAVSLMGHIYVALPFGFMCFIENEHKLLLLAFFCVIWASDTGAYLTGISIGKHKMFERISPKKTWEGFFGGMVFALIVGFIFYKINSKEIDFIPTGSDFENYNLLQHWQWLSFALIVFVFGTLGDLVESMFKRSLNVKDSGSFMPGHGGLLDRFDSAIIAAPVAFVFLMLCS